MKKIIDTKQIQEYGFAELLSTVIQSYKDGWELDLDSNQNYPVSFGTFYSLGMVKTQEDIEDTKTQEVPDEVKEVIEDEKTDEKTEEVLEDVQDVQDVQEGNTEAPKRGRKPKE